MNINYKTLKVGRLELNSYELHSTVTGGFRLKTFVAVRYTWLDLSFVYLFCTVTLWFNFIYLLKVMRQPIGFSSLFVSCCDNFTWSTFIVSDFDWWSHLNFFQGKFSSLLPPQPQLPSKLHAPFHQVGVQCMLRKWKLFSNWNDFLCVIMMFISSVSDVVSNWR